MKKDLLIAVFLMLTMPVSADEKRTPNNDGVAIKEASADISNAAVKLVAKGKTFCSGFLLASRKVITAAHCFDNLQSAGIALSEILVQTNSGKANEIANVANAYIGKDYVKQTHSGRADIAVVILESEIKVKHPYKVISPSEPLSPDDQYLLASYGWNPNLKEKEFYAGTLRKIDVDVTNIDSEGRIFAKNKPGQLSCSADSGGPLFVLKNGLMFYVGIVSGTQTENLTEEEQTFIKSLKPPETMTAEERIQTMRILCGLKGENFWTGVQKHIAFIQSPKSEGRELTSNKATRTINPAEATGHK